MTAHLEKKGVDPTEYLIALAVENPTQDQLNLLRKAHEPEDKPD